MYYALIGTVNLGSVIDFALSPGNDDWNDSTTFTAMIQAESFEYDSDDSLVLHFDFDDGTAVDRSGNQNSGTPHGNYQMVQGVIGQALKFGGYNSPGYVVVPNSATLSFDDDFTFSLWFNLQSNTSMDGWGHVSEFGGQALIGKSGDRNGLVLQVSRSTADGLWHIGAMNGRCCGSSSRGFLTDSGVPLNEWHLVSLASGNGVIRLFLDGTLQNEVPVSEFNLNPAMSGQPVHIGVQQSATWFPLNGVVDEIRIYRRALESTEIQALYCQVAQCIPTLNAVPTEVPANSAPSSIITLANAVKSVGHPIQFKSSLPGSVFTQRIGTVSSNGQLTTTIRSSTPGTAIITAQDLTTGETFPASASVTFTPVGGQPQPPPAQTGPIGITAVRPKHPLDARYLQGIPVPNRIDVTVDWRGTAPGRVDFILNGTTISKAAGGSTVSHTFDMGADLRAGNNSLRIIAVNATGQASSPQDFAPYSVPRPAWLAGLQAVGAIAPMVMGGSVHGGYEYDAKVKFPLGGIDLGAPGFGPPGSSTELGFFVGGSLSLPLVCNSPVRISAEAGAEAEIDLLGVELGGELKGSGNLEGRAVQCEIPTVNGNFRVDIN